MGANVSQLERDIGSDFPANEHYFGLVNVSEKTYFSLWWLQCFDFSIDQFWNLNSSATLATQIRYFKRCISANLSGIKFSSTKWRINERRKLCWHVWRICKWEIFTDLYVSFLLLLQIPFNCNAKEESWIDCAKEIHRQTTKGEGRIVRILIFLLSTSSY